MAVERIEAGVQPAAGEPAVERRLRVVEHALPRLVPVDRRGGVGPELFRTLQRVTVQPVEAARRVRGRVELRVHDLVPLSPPKRSPDMGRGYGPQRRCAIDFREVDAATALRFRAALPRTPR